MRIAAGIEYRGTRYLGWQRQRTGPTVQACLEDALSVVANHPIRVHCAGRTDSGVHALHQVIHFDTGADRKMEAWMLGGNVNLPEDISILWAQPVPTEFHARYSVIGRTYRYVIFNRRSRAGLLSGLVAWECRKLDASRMSRAAAALVGEHDFSAFRAQGCQSRSPVRKVRRVDVSRDAEFVLIEIEANAFLQHMVRNMAGALMEIGLGKRPVEWAREVLESRDRSLGGATAAAEGLYLAKIEYEEKFHIPGPARACPARMLTAASRNPDVATAGWRERDD